MKSFYLLFLFLSLLSCDIDKKSKKEILETPKSEKIDNLANRYLELNRFSGVILVTQGDSIIYNNSFGLADYENNEPFSNQTTFKIGKISELVTANIIKAMAKKSKLKLSDKISKYIPEIKSEMTISNLLDHKTGLPNIQTIQEQHPQLEYSTITFANLALKSSDTAERSDLNYVILGLLIEKVSGKTYQENLENYSKDLHLENTYFQNKRDSSLAVGYLFHNYRGNGLELQRAPVSNSDINFSSNGIKATAKDLAKIISTYASEKLEIDGYLENDGFSYALVNNPQMPVAIVVLSNRRHPVAKEIANSILNILNNKEYALPLPRQEVDIDKNLLKDYSGIYSLNNNMTIEVINENDSLFVMMGPNRIYLVPQ